MLETVDEVVYEWTQSLWYFCKVGIINLVLQVKKKKQIFPKTLCNFQLVGPLGLLKFVSNNF